ncbi:MAG: DUF3048 domain-containing protein, partial [bacterium]
IAASVFVLGACGSTTKSIPDDSSTAQESSVTTSSTESVNLTPTMTPTPFPTIDDPEEVLPDGVYRNYLTGAYVTKEESLVRPISMMIDNSEPAIPQSGISKADVYYESIIESSVSRMCLVFNNLDGLYRIGPLRSCRDNFLSMVSGFDSIYEHYGQAAYALPYLEDDRCDNVSGLGSYTNQVFFRDNTFHVMPHNAYTSEVGMETGIKTLGYRTEHDETYRGPFRFVLEGEKTDMTDAVDANVVVPGYPVNNPRFLYDEATGLYKREQFGAPHIDTENGEQIQVKNIIFEYENSAFYQDSPYLHFQTEAQGYGLYISEGKAIPIYWERPEFFAQVKYYTMDGHRLKMNQGKTFVCVIENKKIQNAKVGKDEKSLKCVVSEDKVKEANAINEQWEKEYKENEHWYLTACSDLRLENIAKHNGKSKVCYIYDTEYEYGDAGKKGK